MIEFHVRYILPQGARTRTVPQVYARVDGEEIVLATVRLSSEASAMLGALNRIDLLALHRALRIHLDQEVTDERE